MKKLFFCFLCLCITLKAFCYTFESNGIFYDVTSNNTVTVTSGDWEYSGNIEIPSSVKYNGTTYTVTAIGRCAFMYSDLFSITLPNTIQRIETLAFAYCSNLSEILITENITDIESMAFSGCTGLTKVYLHCNTIQGSAFADCENLQSITIGKNVKEITYSSFLDCPNLNSIYVQSNNPVFDSRNNCNAIIETATNTIVLGCRTTRILNTIKSIGDWAFCGRDISTIVLPESVTVIGENSFRECKNASFKIPKYLKNIGDNAFWDCELSVVEIPKTTEYIGEAAFRSSEGMIIKVDGNNPYFDSRNNCNAIIETATNTLILGCENTVIPQTVKTIGSYAFNNCAFSSIDIPNSVKSLGKGCFHNSDLTNIVLPNSITNIGEAAFYSCSKLETIVLPDLIINIPFSTFSQCRNLKEISIPDKVESIGDYAFNYCKSLKKISLPDNITTIGVDAFCNCDNIEKVILGKNVKTLGNNAFNYCYNIKTIISRASTPPVCGENGNVFNSYIKSGAELIVPINAKNLYKSAKYWKDFKNISESDFSAIENIIIDGEDSIEYYNMQGAKVESPCKGIYIMRKGNKLLKIII